MNDINFDKLIEERIKVLTWIISGLGIHGYSISDSYNLTWDYICKNYNIELNDSLDSIKIDNNIYESFCSIELCKLLEEKECVIETQSYYDKDGNIYSNFDVNTENPDKYHNFIIRPTLTIACKWILKNYNIWISTDFDGKEWFECITIITKNDREIRNGYSSPEEAIEKAILYTLKNLI